MSFILKNLATPASFFYGHMIANKVNIDFAVIGFPKCATTSIHKTLEAVPAVYMPDFEVQVPSLIKGWLKRPTDCVKLGIKNPNIIYELHNFMALLKSNRNMKFIVSLRNPSEWIFSFYQYRMLEIKENKKWLLPILKKHPEYRNVTFNNIVYDDIDFLGVSKQAGFFVDYLSRLLTKCEASRILILLTEEIAGQPLKAYERIYQFLEIDSTNQSSSGIEANKNNMRYDKKSEFTEQFSYLNEFYKPKNKELNDLLKSNWGYENTYW